jgi:hypothetical protein
MDDSTSCFHTSFDDPVKGRLVIPFSVPLATKIGEYKTGRRYYRLPDLGHYLIRPAPWIRNRLSGGAETSKKHRYPGQQYEEQAFHFKLPLKKTAPERYLSGLFIN